MRNYTGPRWLTPLFIAMAATALLFIFILPHLDTEVEWEHDGDDS